MSNEVDELARDIDTVLYTDSFYGDMFRQGQSRETLIDAILAAGYRKPRTITTTEEADALPDRSAILTPGEIIFHKWENYHGKGDHAWERELGQTTRRLSPDAHLPATVLYVPEAQK